MENAWRGLAWGCSQSILQPQPPTDSNLSIVLWTRPFRVEFRSVYRQWSRIFGQRWGILRVKPHVSASSFQMAFLWSPP
jgi:hypothetical protein